VLVVRCCFCSCDVFVVSIANCKVDYALLGVVRLLVCFLGDVFGCKIVRMESAVVCF
jgi:hypothetical protein